MPRSAALRIAFAYGFAFALATSLLGAAVYLVAHRALARQFDERISTEMSSLVNEYRGEGEIALEAVIRNRELAHVTSDMAYGLFSRDGARVAGSLHTSPLRPGWRTLAYQDPVEGPDSARALAVDIAPNRRLVVAADWDTLNDLDTLILVLLAAALAGVVVLATLGALGLTVYLQSRLAMIAGGAEKIIAGDLTQRIPLSPRNDEFDRLAAILNTMLERIAALLDNLRQVSADVAHDLRMPLTRLRNQLERALEKDHSHAEIERAIDQADQVLMLFGSILRLSEIEAGQLRLSFVPVNLAELARELVDSYRLAIDDGGRSFSSHITPTPPIDGDRELLAQAVINLLDNAQIHTPPGTMIMMTVAATPDRVELSVADNGLGVSDQDRARISGRFIRLEASRSQPGHGLGLSLVAAIAQMHDAELVFEDNDPGLVSKLVFPT